MPSGIPLVATPANCTNTLGNPASCLGIVIDNPSAPVTVTGDTSLTNGINMSGATVNLTLNCGTVALGANQTWTGPSGLTLTTGGPASSASAIDHKADLGGDEAASVWVRDVASRLFLHKQSVIRAH
jgi:hypothetical protein